MEGVEFSSIESGIQSLTLDQNTSPFCIVDSSCYYSLLKTNAHNKEDAVKVQQNILKRVLDHQRCEREDASFSRMCLFCKKHFTENRSMLLNHLMEQHNFMIGAPDNIVFINELLDHLEQLLKNLQCFYCEKIFKDWLTLKEHMRKKQHKRINPQNKSYDRFYVINYLEPGKTWLEVQEEEEGFSQDSSEQENDMMDCTDENLVFVCLFCSSKISDFDMTLEHMKEKHMFDFVHLKKTHHLNFYSQIKFINYIRKKVYEKECIYCEAKFPFQDDLLSHMMNLGHTVSLPDPSKWDQPSYYFSTFENDNLLCALDADDADLQDCPVLPEDPVFPASLASVNVDCA